MHCWLSNCNAATAIHIIHIAQAEQMQIVALLKLLFSRRGRAHQPNMAYVVTRVARRTSRRAAMISRVRTYHPTTGLAADVLDVDPIPFSIIITSAECNIDVVDSLKAIDADPIPFSVFTLREYPPSLVTYVATSAHKFTDATSNDQWQQRKEQVVIAGFHRRRYRILLACAEMTMGTSCCICIMTF